MNKLTAAALALFLAMTFCACQQPADTRTPESVLKEMQTAMQTTPCTESVAQGGLAFTMELMDLELELALTVQEQITASTDPAALHLVTAGQMEVSTLGTSIPLDSEVYVLAGEDGAVRYRREDEDWQKERITDVGAAAITADIPTRDLALDTEAELDGVPVFLVTGTLPGSALAEHIGTLLGGNGVDLTAIQAGITLYIDAASLLPVYEKITLHGVDAALLSLFGGTLGESELAALNLRLTVGDMSMTRAFTSYEAGSPITLPDADF